MPRSPKGTHSRIFVSVSSPADRLSAALAGRYRIERELGAGGMATVYLAEDLKHDRKVAIKVLKPELAAVLGAERFVVEIKTTAAMSHPHILPLFDSGTADGFLFYVMPYIQGETIREKLNRETQFGVEEAVRIAREVADALDYAHRHGVIHRDIKPENILLHDGRAMVMDFGIALAVSAAAGGRMTETGLSLGTPHYMSPEQATAEKEITARSDVYSLASVLYEMLAGEPPHTAGNAQAVIMKIITESAQPVRQLRKNVSPGVEAALAMALEKLPADRFESAKAFADALGEAHFARTLSGRGVGVRSGALEPAEWRRVMRHPLTIGLAVFALVASTWAGWLGTHPRGAEGVTAVRFTVDPPARTRNSMSNAGGGLLAISPDGSLVVFAALDERGIRRLYTRNIHQLAAQALAGTENPSSPFVSPAGDAVGFWSEGRLSVVALAGGAPQALADVPPFTGATWSPSGDIVFAPTNRTHLMRVSATGGEIRPAGAIDSARGEMAQYFPVALPDGKHVLYTSWGNGGVELARVGLLDLTTGRSHRLNVRGASGLGMVDDQLIYADLAGAVMAVSFDLASGEPTGAPVPVMLDVASTLRGRAIAALSASGTLAYADRNQETTLMHLSAGGLTQVLPDVRRFSFPRYSPDGARIAVTVASGTSTDIWLADAASKALSRLTAGGALNERPEWTPDGKRVLFRTIRGTRSSIWWQPSDRSAPAAPLLADDGHDYFEAVVTPNGREIVFQVDTGGSDILVRALEGSASPRPIATARADESMARVSPDGRWVAYVSNETAEPQVMVQSLDGGGARVQVSVASGTEPVWSRDGRRVFYRSAGKFIAADVVTTPSFRVVSRTDFADDVYASTPAPHANYDVAPNGRELLVLKGPDERVVVALGWADELRNRRKKQ